MPVEIKELVIRAEFGGPGSENREAPAGGAPDVPQEELIQECVRQVLEVIERKRER